jgi:ribosome recycling factor
VNDGVLVRISIPPLTEERRKDLTKHVKKLAEDAKIVVRNARQEAHNHFKTLKSDSEITEDDWHVADKDLQHKVDEANASIDEVAAAKEKDVMTV